ncbi:HAD-IA family hydrolase [Candidatus Formimonas warabiya]|uniref:HAD family hydrolase n=1 Tax=Formimonas warabiya TaxID=1761012 RepID=A0A3G1KXU5_FORW1|nr:HAD-IA family hydrolase [Candidatus Formimonas warabiya]ATW27343.1 HAD family hydrolase [Candidatus Formimonas warabiya]
MLKYIIFDFDGTLVDSKDVFVSVYNRIAEKYRYKKLEQKDIEALRRLSIKERCRFLHFPMYKFPFLAMEAYHLYKESLANVVLVAGMKELLEELHHQGYLLAIISSNSEHNIREFLEKHRVDHIEQIICTPSIFGKDTAIKKFLTKNDLKNSQVIYVGDEHRDIVACKKNGVRVIWVAWGYDAIDMVKEEGPDYLVQMPDEVLGILKEF